MIEFISQPWPWYVAGPLIGIVVPLLFLVGGKQFGLSENLRHVCAMLPGKTDFFNYDWRNGSWNLVLMLGIVIGGFIGATWLGNPDPVAISEATRSDLALLGVTNFNGLLPADIYSWEGLGTLRGLILLVGGGFLIGFGTR